MSKSVFKKPTVRPPRIALLDRFVSDCSGATAIEYGLIGALIALAVTPQIRTAMTKLWGGLLNSISNP